MNESIKNFFLILKFSSIFLRNGLYIAARDQGACTSLISLKLYYHYCPEITHNLTYFPKTAAGGMAASLVSVNGTCVSNAVEANNEGMQKTNDLLRL